MMLFPTKNQAFRVNQRYAPHTCLWHKECRLIPTKNVLYFQRKNVLRYPNHLPEVTQEISPPFHIALVSWCRSKRLPRCSTKGRQRHLATFGVSQAPSSGAFSRKLDESSVGMKATFQPDPFASWKELNSYFCSTLLWEDILLKSRGSWRLYTILQ